MFKVYDTMIYRKRAAMREGRRRPSLCPGLRNSVCPPEAAMREGRRRPSLGGQWIDPPPPETAAMREGRRRPSLEAMMMIERRLYELPQ